jgi:multicomponent Na+:H+ antiporter subunit D
MGGLRERMPVTGATSLVASMSIAGVPPFNGFFSKLLVIVACVEAGHHGFALLAVIGSVLTLASFAKVQRYGFLGELREKWRGVREAPVFMSVAMIALAVACLGLSLLALPGVWQQVLVPAAEALRAGPFKETAANLAGM